MCIEQRVKAAEINDGIENYGNKGRIYQINSLLQREYRRVH